MCFAVFFIGYVTSKMQFDLECNKRLNFSVGNSSVCYSIPITNDMDCELEDCQTEFQIQLALITNDDEGLRVNSSLDIAKVVIDDSMEPECCKSMYILHTTNEG